MEEEGDGHWRQDGKHAGRKKRPILIEAGRFCRKSCFWPQLDAFARLWTSSHVQQRKQMTGLDVPRGGAYFHARTVTLPPKGGFSELWQ